MVQHQPIEHLSSLRSIPNLNVFRLRDSTETIECWELALTCKNKPSVISLTRQNLNQLRTVFESKNLSSLGAYEIFRSNENIKLTLMASYLKLILRYQQQKTGREKHLCKSYFGAINGII